MAFGAALICALLMTACSASSPPSSAASGTLNDDAWAGGSGAANAASGSQAATIGGSDDDASRSGGAETSGSGAGSAGAGATAGASNAARGVADAGDAVAVSVIPDAGDASVVDASAPSSDGSSWPAVTDYSAPGPFVTTRDNNTGPGAVYDIFRPAMLGQGARKNPIVSWANGTMYNVESYKLLLDHWASYGFVVIAAQTQQTAGGATHKAAIDWLIAQAADSASPFFGVLDTTKIAASGHSQGGGATIAAGANAPGPVPLTTTMPLMPYLGFEKDLTIISRQTVAMGNIVATNDTTAPGVADQIYQGINTELVQAAFIGVHTDAMNPAMYGPTLAWLRFRLMGDAQASQMFYPATTCGLCQDPAWQYVRYKNTP